MAADQSDIDGIQAGNLFNPLENPYLEETELG